MRQGLELLGVGIYTVPEASRLARVSAPRIRRWLRGYYFRVGDATHESPPVWTPDLEAIDGALALSFRDMIEVRFVDYFLRHGISWQLLRRAGAHAASIVGSTHPFSTQRFKTDGRRVFAEFQQEHGGKSFLELVSGQYNFPAVVEPRLYAGLEFEKGQASRWYPLSNSKRVVIDPSVSFGQPTIQPEGVPTVTLARAFGAEKSLDKVAYWYEVPKKSVSDAIEYQRLLAA